MVNWRKQLVPTIAATSLLLASGTLANGISQAEEVEKVEKAILIPGAMPLQGDQPDLSDRRRHLPGYRDPLSRRQSRLAAGRVLAEPIRL